MKVYRSVRAIEPGHVDPYYWDKGSQTITILEDDTPRNTGLLDATGNPIVSCNVMQPIGFGRQ